MIFRFFLQHESFGTWPISEPMGWDSAKLKLTRDPEFHSLVEEFDIEATFYGDNGTHNGGVEIIKQVERIYGVDTELRLVTEMSFDDGITYPLSFTGLLSLDEAEENPNNQITIPVIPDDLWTKFFKRKDIPVNVQSYTGLDNEALTVFDPINLRLTNQKVQQQYSGYFDEGQIIFEDPATNTYADYYVQVDFPAEDLSEITEKYRIPIDVNSQLPVWIYDLEYAGSYAFDIRFEVSRATLALETTNDMENGTGGYFIRFYIQINDQTPVEFDIANIPFESTVYAYSETHELNRGDIVRVYGLFGPDDLGLLESLFIWGSDNTDVETTPGSSFNLGPVPSGLERPSYMNIVAQTVFVETNSFGFLLHDTAGQIIDRITNEDQVFYSEHLGSLQTKYKQYPSNGCAWAFGLVKGLQLRQYTLLEKPFFQSFNEWWAGANPILNLGLGLDTVDGDDVIRIEEKGHFYDQSSTSTNFDFVRDMVRSYDRDMIFNKMTVGYKKWQSEDISGIDDPQSKHEYASRAKLVGRSIDLTSDFIAASLAIETTRRKTRQKSADYKFDNDTFIIALNPTQIEVSPDTSPEVEDFVPELDENFSLVENLLNAETRYNLILTPSRNFFRWGNYLTAWLQEQYRSSIIKFVSGEGNFDMISDYNCAVGNECIAVICDEFMENQDIPLGDTPVNGTTNYYIPFGKLHSHYQYDITIDISYEQYLAIRNNRELAIGISQTDENHVKFFIKTLEYEIKTGNAKISAWPVEYMDLQIIEQEFTMRCTPSEEECEDAITDEFAEQLTDELGRCITA